MHDALEICIEHRGQTKCFPAAFSQFGYSYRITVDVFNTPVIFEFDEERQWRARLENITSPNKELQELVPLIAAELEKNLQ